MSKDMEKQTLCHEILHGILVQLGYNGLNNDEQFVQAVSNAIFQAFDVKTYD